MNTQAYEKIIELLAPALEKCKFSAFELGEDENKKRAWKNERHAVMVDYLEDKQQFVLLVTAVEDGEPSSTWSTSSAWLFTDSSDDRDIRSIASDFSDSVCDLSGVKTVARTSGSSAVSGPSKVKDGEDITPEGFAQKLLAVFPFLKETYASEIAEKGEFLYVDFFERYVVPAVREVIEKNDRKKCEKLFDMFNTVYVFGTAETRAALTFVVIAGAVGGDAELRSRVDGYIEKHTYLRLVMPPVYNRAQKATKKAANIKN